MAKKIKIPGSHPVQIYSDGVTINIPGDTPVEVASPGVPDTVWVSSAGGNYWVSSTGGDYWVSTV